MAVPPGLQGETEEFALYLAHAAAAKLQTTWAIGESGAAGPSGSRYGDPAGHVWVAVTGPYAFLKTAGPARLAITDRGLTFATNGDRGVLISFHSAVRGLDPLGILRHPELTVTVADIDGLVERLRSGPVSRL